MESEIHLENSGFGKLKSTSKSLSMEELMER